MNKRNQTIFPILALCLLGGAIYLTMALIYQRLVYSPRAVLENASAFWEEEAPQKYTRLWAEAVGYNSIMHLHDLQIV
jgi:hypothetical protein